MDERRYAIKNALLYSLLVALILLAPLFVYTVYMKSIYEIQNELELKQRSSLIISSMEEHESRGSEYFDYPRFNSIESGLYDLHFNPVFTLIENPMVDFSVGYHIYKDYAYLVIPLPRGRYFDADYLIVSNHISYLPVYKKASMVLLSVVILVFMLSLFFLNLFARPFKKINKKLDNFIKDSMHEINTPLSIININIDLYNRKHISSKYFNRIKAATKTLANIYNDMDYLIKNEKLVFEYKKIDATHFTNERVAYFNEVAAMKKIEIVSDIEDGVFLNFNTIQLQRVVDNNLSNAIKYSHEESTIEVALKYKDGRVELLFKDYGIGVDDAKRIFDRYYREDTGKGGFGIGLNIVKAIIDKAGIDIKVSSKPNVGSIFTYTFPSDMSIKKHK